MPTGKLDIEVVFPEIPEALRKQMDSWLGYDLCKNCGQPTFTFVKGPLKTFTRFGCWHTQARMAMLAIQAVLKKAPVKKPKPKRKRA